MSVEKEISNFDRLVPKAAELHSSTWCVKAGHMIPTISLQGRICCNCREFVLRGGICDPL